MTLGELISTLIHLDLDDPELHHHEVVIEEVGDQLWIVVQ